MLFRIIEEYAKLLLVVQWLRWLYFPCDHCNNNHVKKEYIDVVHYITKQIVMHLSVVVI